MADTVLTNKDGVEVFRGAQSGGSQAVNVVTKTLDNAEILALPTTAIQVLAAPGAGFANIPIHATLRLTWAGDYGGIDGGSTLEIRAGSQPILAALNEAINSGVSGLLAGGEAATAVMPASADVPPSAGTIKLLGQSGMFDSDIGNKAINLHTSNTLDFSGGDAGNSLKVTLLYYTVTF